MIPVFGSWVELHAAMTHFPIALLLTALFFDGCGLLLRRPALRDYGLAVLALAVVALPFALLTGYLAGSTMRRPPAGFDPHWKAAVLTFIVAALLLFWRLKTRSRVERVPQFAMLGVAFVSAMAVGYTGHMGGAMVYGGRSEPEEVAQVLEAPAKAQPEDKGSAEKVAQAAGRMENAAGRLAKATDSLAASASSPPSLPPPAASVPSAPSEPVRVDTAPLDDATRKLERAAKRFEESAAKAEAALAKLQPRDGSQAPKAAANTAPPAKQPAKTAQSTPPKAPASGAPPSAGATPEAQPPAAPAGPDPQLVAAGQKLYYDDELGCTGCHKLAGKGGRSGPDLTLAGKLHPDLEWQIAHLKDPKSKIPTSSMPAYNDIPEADVRALAAFMVSLQ